MAKSIYPLFESDSDDLLHSRTADTVLTNCLGHLKWKWPCVRSKFLPLPITECKHTSEWQQRYMVNSCNYQKVILSSSGAQYAPSTRAESKCGVWTTASSPFLLSSKFACQDRFKIYTNISSHPTGPFPEQRNETYPEAIYLTLTLARKSISALQGNLQPIPSRPVPSHPLFPFRSSSPTTLSISPRLQTRTRTPRYAMTCCDHEITAWLRLYTQE